MEKIRGTTQSFFSLFEHANLKKQLYIAAMKRLGQLAILSLVIQWILSLIYYLQRIAFLDAAFVLVKIINEQQPTIMVGRYGAILTQSWPWVGVLAGWSLDTLMLLYSVSFTTLNLVVGILLYRMRRHEWSVVLATYFLLFYTDSFFWTNNEIHQAFALFALGAGYFDYLIRRRPARFRLKILASSLLISFAILTHPLMLIIVGYYFIYLVLDRQWVLNRVEQLVIAIVILFSGLVKYMLSSHNWYDSQKFEMINELSWTEWMSVYHQPLFHHFFNDLLSHYQPALLALLLAILLLVVTHRWLLLSLTLLFTFLHISMVSVVVNEFHRFYVESQWMLLAFFIWFPIVTSIRLLSERWKVSAILLFTITLTWWGIRFTASLETFTYRLDWHEERIGSMVDNNKQKMILVDPCSIAITSEEPSCPEVLDKLQMLWGMPAESLLLSSRNGDSRTYIHKDYFIAGGALKAFHNCFDTVRVESMNGHYFNLNPDEVYKQQPRPVY